MSYQDEFLILEDDLYIYKMETDSSTQMKIVYYNLEVCYGDTTMIIYGYHGPMIVGIWHSDSLCVVQLENSKYEFLEYRSEFGWIYLNKKKALEKLRIDITDLEFLTIDQLDNMRSLRFYEFSVNIPWENCENYEEYD
ncbi:MAG: hypothetical protein AAF388_00895 [Bacteroidota bacterium]